MSGALSTRIRETGLAVPRLVVAPDGRRYAPTGFEPARRTVVGDPRTRNPRVDLALAGWATAAYAPGPDRVTVDAPDGFGGAGSIREFARAHEADRVVVAFHPSGEMITSTTPATLGSRGAAGVD